MSAIVADYSVDALVEDAKRKAGRSGDYQAGLSRVLQDSLAELNDAREVLYINAILAASILSEQITQETEQ